MITEHGYHSQVKRDLIQLPQLEKTTGVPTQAKSLQVDSSRKKSAGRVWDLGSASNNDLVRDICRRNQITGKGGD